jgi:hypothetical protein
MPNVRAKVATTVWRAGTAAQNWGEAPAPQAQCATPLGLSLSEWLGRTAQAHLQRCGTRLEQQLFFAAEKLGEGVAPLGASRHRRRCAALAIS